MKLHMQVHDNPKVKSTSEVLNVVEILSHISDLQDLDFAFITRAE